MKNTIPLFDFCELHGKSYGAARANGVVTALIKAKKAIRYGERGPVYVLKTAEWPKGYSAKLSEKRRKRLILDIPKKS